MANPVNASINNGMIRDTYCSLDLGYCKGEERRILVTYPSGESMSSNVIFEPVLLNQNLVIHTLVDFNLFYRPIITYPRTCTFRSASSVVAS